MTTVVTIAGWDRSGSTILGELLSARKGVISIGEVVNLWKRGYVEDRRCSCGEPFSRCPFWEAVTTRAFAAPPARIAQTAMRAQSGLGNLWLLLTRLPIFGPRLLRRADPYRSLLQRLYAAVAVESGASVIIDASKTPWHSAVTAGLEGFDVCAIHLVRDPRGVAYSLRKHMAYDTGSARPDRMDRHGTVFASLAWNFRRLVVEHVLGKICPTFTVKYEDLATDPVAVLKDVWHFIGDSGAGPGIGRSGDEPNSHNISGNPARFAAGRPLVELDDKWKRALPGPARRAVTLLTLSGLWKHGYPIRAEKPIPPAPDGVTGEPVSVIIATRDRPDLLRRAIRSMLAQDLPCVTEILVVYDQSEPDDSLRSEFPGAPIRILHNTRKPGLPGARNTGILQARGSWIAFCDDDDWWAPDRLRRQMGVLEDRRDVRFVVGGIAIHCDAHITVRLPPEDRLPLSSFIRSRVMEAHPSTFLIHHSVFSAVGLVDEDLPGGYAEDYDLLIRAARWRPVDAVLAPVAHIAWHAQSYFGMRWHTIDEALRQLVAKTPEFASDPRGLARITGQRAFACAAAGDTRLALRLAWSALRLDVRQPRPYLALLVATRLVRAERLVRWANVVGRGF